MEEKIETISYIQIGDNRHPIDATLFGGSSIDSYQEKNLVTSIDENSTDDQYPSAACVYSLMGQLEELLKKI